MVLFFAASATAQKKEKSVFENYFTEIQVGLNSGKDNAGFKQTSLDLSARGVYGWLYWQGAKSFPFKKTIGQSFEKITQFSLGYGKRVNLDPYNLKEEGKKMELVFGIGPSVVLVPEFGSYPKKSRIHYGGSAFGVLEGNSLRAELFATIVTLPPGNRYDWSNNFNFGEVEVIKFFSGFGLGINFKIHSNKHSEKQIINQPFNGFTSSETKTSINPFLCYKTNSGFIFRAGISMPRNKNSWSDLNNPQGDFSAWTDPIGFNLGFVMDLKN